MRNAVFYGLWCKTEPLCVQSLSQLNPALDDRIFDCLLASMAAVPAEDVRASFLFVGDLNGHHQECLGSTTTNRHGVAAFDFATVSGCDQLVVSRTHACGGTLDLEHLRTRFWVSQGHEIPGFEIRVKRAYQFKKCHTIVSVPNAISYSLYYPLVFQAGSFVISG